MADTLNNVTLKGGELTNLYEATGISVGTKISVQLLSGTSVRLVTKATEPTVEDGFRVIQFGEIFENDSGDSGAWAYSPSIDAVVNVGVA